MLLSAAARRDSSVPPGLVTGIGTAVPASTKLIGNKALPTRVMLWCLGNRRSMRIPVNVTADSGIVTGISGERDRGVGVARLHFMPRCFFG
jgi:hypothetical protein